MLPGKSRKFCSFFFSNNIFFHNSHLFLPSTYTLRVLIDVPPLFDFLIFFEFVRAKKNFFFIHIDWYTCKILSNLVSFPYFDSCLGLVFIWWGQTDPILAKFHPIRFSSPFIKYFEKFHPTCLFHSVPPFIKYLGKFQTPCLFHTPIY